MGDPVLRQESCLVLYGMYNTTIIHFSKFCSFLPQLNTVIGLTISHLAVFLLQNKKNNKKKLPQITCLKINVWWSISEFVIMTWSQIQCVTHCIILEYDTVSQQQQWTTLITPTHEIFNHLYLQKSQGKFGTPVCSNYTVNLNILGRGEKKILLI